jgi:trypsin
LRSRLAVTAILAIGLTGLFAVPSGAASVSPPKAKRAASKVKAKTSKPKLPKLGSNRIVGGRQAAVAEYPFAVYLESGGFVCGASLIAKRWVLTAAHCLPQIPALGVEVPAPGVAATVGRTNLDDTSTGQRITAAGAIVHGSYSATNNRNDVALIRLSADANYTPVKVAGAGQEAQWTAGKTATIIGWGNTSEGGNTSSWLLEAEVPVVADATCSSNYGTSFHAATMLCAGYAQGGTDTCQGDSGGPLIVPGTDGAWRQAGVTSWGDGCARAGKPGVYTRIGAPALRNWISARVPGSVG